MLLQSSPCARCDLRSLQLWSFVIQENPNKHSPHIKPTYTRVHVCNVCMCEHVPQRGLPLRVWTCDYMFTHACASNWRRVWRTFLSVGPDTHVAPGGSPALAGGPAHGNYRAAGGGRRHSQGGEPSREAPFQGEGSDLTWALVWSSGLWFPGASVWARRGLWIENVLFM